MTIPMAPRGAAGRRPEGGLPTSTSSAYGPGLDWLLQHKVLVGGLARLLRPKG